MQMAFQSARWRCEFLGTTWSNKSDTNPPKGDTKPPGGDIFELREQGATLDFTAQEKSSKQTTKN
jgi:hypothetical protein